MRRDLQQILAAAVAATGLYAGLSHAQKMQAETSKAFYDDMAGQALAKPNELGSLIYVKGDLAGYVQSVSPDIKVDLGGNAIPALSKLRLSWDRIKCGSLGIDQDSYMKIDRMTGAYDVKIASYGCREPVKYYVNILSR